MKKLFMLMAVCFSAVAAYAQPATSAPTMPYNEEKKAIIYTEVVQLPGLTQAQVYDKVYAWLNSAYERVDTKITEKNKEEGKIVLNGISRLVYKDAKGKETLDPHQWVKYKLAIYVKDGRFKYEFYDLHLDKGGYKMPMEKYYTWDAKTKSDDVHMYDRLHIVHNDITRLIADMKKSVTSTPVQKKDDW